jgi:hypothetical protein
VARRATTRQELTATALLLVERTNHHVDVDLRCRDSTGSVAEFCGDSRLLDQVWVVRSTNGPRGISERLTTYLKKAIRVSQANPHGHR